MVRDCFFFFVFDAISHPYLACRCYTDDAMRPEVCGVLERGAARA